MTQNLTLVTQKPFGSLTCNVYQDDSNKNEFYMTREQVGAGFPHGLSSLRHYLESVDGS